MNKKVILAVAVLGLLASCSVETSGKIDFDADDIKYDKDSRTGLCFGVVASEKWGDASASGLGMTCVPCEEVEHLIQK